VIETRGVTKYFGSFAALRDVSIALHPGRLTGVLGPNGSGKSTLIKCLLGLVRPSDGLVLYNGKLPDTAGAYRAQIGYMPQRATFPGDLTGREVLAMLSNLRSEKPPRMEFLIDLFDLHSHLARRTRTLSGGTRQKLSAVVAGMYEPSLLILDEPTAGLDPEAGGVFKEYVSGRKAQGCAVLMTTHIIHDLEEMADDVVLLLEGSVCYAGSVRDLKLATDSPLLETAVGRMMKQGAA
jgi:Cu-processing system ATP-binding protein